MSRHARALRLAVEGDTIAVVPGAFDALSALLVEGAGFPAVYLSGASLAYTRLGRPDVGLLGLTELAGALAAMRERVSLPIVVDADTGFGNALNVIRTVRLLEREGASAIQLEDQQLPKRCGHLPGKTLITADEMVGKIRAATDARASDETLVVARTDAVAVEGMDAAIERAARYAEAGADVLFVEAPRSEAQLARVARALARDRPLLANMVEGGDTPPLPASRLASLGYSIVIFPGGLVRALARAGQRFLAELAAQGTSAGFADEMLDFASLNALLGTPELMAEGERYAGDGADESDGTASRATTPRIMDPASRPA